MMAPPTFGAFRGAGGKMPARVARRYVRVAMLVLLPMVVFFHGTVAGQPEAFIKLQVGEVRVLPVPEVIRVVVGNGRVVNAVTTEEKEVILFARHGGSSSLHVWSASGPPRRYRVEVVPDGLPELQHQLRTVLERLPNVRVTTVGDKLLVEGDSISDGDRERIAMLGKQYPQLLDFTSQVGWDRMVLLDVRVIEVPRNQLRELGVRWEPATRGGFSTGLLWDGGSRRPLERPGVEDGLAVPFPAARAVGYFGVNALLSARIDAMAKTGSAVVLAQPQLLARSGATAEFLAGGEVPYSTIDANGNANTAFKPYGVSLRITPRIEHNRAVRSRVEVEVSSVDTSMSAPGGPALKTRRAATEFNVRSGQTLVLAGFLSREASHNVDKIPALGDIPVLGRLFGSHRLQRGETELAIFVTPTVVSPDQPDLAQRVERGRAIVEAAFPEPDLLNVPVAAPVVPPPPARARAGSAAWNPYAGAGSQWAAPATVGNRM